MSSPKRVARGAVRRATNAASRGGAAKSPAKPTAKADNGASAEARRLAADALQTLIAATCRSYAARRQAGEDFTPVAKSTVSATDVMITASGLLKAADLSTFELGMWQGFTGR
jgi:hypothetical protein